MAKKSVSPFKEYYISRKIEEELGTTASVPTKDYKNGDFVIAVMDRGWVYAGFITRLDNDRIRLDCAYNVHRWGTTKGLGEIAVGGPTEETILNEAGTIYGKDIFVMHADIERW